MQVILLATIYLAMCMEIHAAEDGVTLNGEDLSVLYNGEKSCMTQDCSPISKGNTTCKIYGDLHFDEQSVAAPKSDILDVAFEIYYDEKSGHNKLSLIVEWSPADNTDLEKSFGYSVNISTPRTEYRMTYLIGSILSYEQNYQDIFKSDCFGKQDETGILPGETVTVSITSLPPLLSDLGDSTAINTIKVPDCSYQKFISLTACNSTKACISDCSTTSIGYQDKLLHPVSCAMSTKSFHSRHEQCVPVDREHSGTVSAPRRVSGGWYKFRDPDTSEIKVALNFSWKPGDDASMTALHSFQVHIVRTNVTDPLGYNKCFSINTQLQQYKHGNAIFYYDCYGRDPSSALFLLPQHSFHIAIQGQPNNNEHSLLMFTLKVPDCDHPDMQDVSSCIVKNKSILKGVVEKVHCKNRSLTYSYQMSPKYGNSATVALCQLSPGKTIGCPERLKYEDNLSPNGTLYNLSLTSSHNLSMNYTVYLNGDEERILRNYAPVDFSVCNEPVVPRPQGTNKLLIIIVLVVGILILAAVVFLVCFWYKRNSTSSKIRKIFPCCNEEGANVSPAPVPGQLIPLPPLAPVLEETKKIRVYVLFTEDHEYHTTVVHWFCSYLRMDLGLDVRMSKWNSLEVSENPAAYMNSNLNNADKVVVICSAGSRDCMKKAQTDGNMFAPAVRQIIQKAFVGDNPGKYLVGYFDYSSPNDVPELLRDQITMYCSLYKLMKQFEQFYFSLVGKDQYEEGKIYRIEKIAPDRYHDPTLSNCGSKLKAAIDEMTKLVRDKPTWYSDSQGSDMAGLDLPPEPVLSTIPLDQPMDVSEGIPSINLLHFSQPPIIPNGNASGARRKVIKSSKSEDVVPVIVQEGNVMISDSRHKATPHLKRNDPTCSLATITSDDGSFEITESDLNNMSLVSKTTDHGKRPSPPVEHAEPLPVYQRSGPTEHALPMAFESIPVVHSFLPSSFHGLNDPSIPTEPLADDRHCDAITVPLSEQSSILDDLPDTNTLPQQEETSPAPLENEVKASPESGIFIAKLDEVDEDYEEQIKSINLLV